MTQLPSLARLDVHAVIPTSGGSRPTYEEIVKKKVDELMAMVVTNADNGDIEFLNIIKAHILMNEIIQNSEWAVSAKKPLVTLQENVQRIYAQYLLNFMDETNNFVLSKLDAEFFGDAHPERGQKIGLVDDWPGASGA